jgi:formate-dependent nitrite reductase membrane component NrfD
MSNQRYNQLIQDLRSDYRPQREWGEGRGMLMVIGHFLVGVAGGTWLMASFYGVTAGLVVAFVLGILGGLAHLLFLGNPKNTLKMMRHFRTSWVSRGFIGLSIFLAGGGLYLLLLMFPSGGIEWKSLFWIARVAAAIGTIIIIGYMGFCYTASKAIPFWHSPLHPAIYIAFAVRGGIATLLVIGAVLGTAADDWLLKLWLFVTVIVTLFYALELQNALTSGNVAARRSAGDLLSGRLAFIFYGGTLVLGLVVPVLLLTVMAELSPAVMAVIGLASVAGDFFMKLTTVRAGVYLPLVLPARRKHA